MNTAMFADDVAKTTLAIILNYELSFFMQDTDKQSDAHSQTSQFSYAYHQHCWDATQPLKLVDWKLNVV